MGVEGVLEKGFVTTSADKLINWARTGSLKGLVDPAALLFGHGQQGNRRIRSQSRLRSEAGRCQRRVGVDGGRTSASRVDLEVEVRRPAAGVAAVADVSDRLPA